MTQLLIRLDQKRASIPTAKQERVRHRRSLARSLPSKPADYFLAETSKLTNPTNHAFQELGNGNGKATPATGRLSTFQKKLNL